MKHLEFNFGNALLHFARTGGPKGFLLKFALAYFAVQLVVQAVSIVLQWPVYEAYMGLMDPDADPEAVMEEVMAVSMRSNIVSILMMPIGLLVWVVFEAANQRRYMRAEGFRLALGPDEGRIFVVGLIWFAMLIALYIGLVIVMVVPLALIGISGGGAGAGLFMILIMLVTFFAFFYFLVRWSPAAAMTVRDENIRFFESWRVTRGRFWTLFGANLVIWLGFIAFTLVVYGIAAAIVVPQVLPVANADGDVAAVLRQPSVWGPLIPLGVAYLFSYGFFLHIMSGPAALAAKTDPDWVGQPGIADTF